MKLNTQLSRTPLGFRQQTGHAGILFVMMVPFLFGVFFLGTEGARAVQDKARLAEAIETTALVLATENADADDDLVRKERAEAFIHYYFPDAEIAQLTIDRTLCSETNCGMSPDGSPFLEFSVSATIQQTKWFRSFDKEIDYYNVADFNRARKYQPDGFDVTFAVNMSDTMLKKRGCTQMRACLNYPVIGADDTRLVKAKRIIFEITEALKEYNQTATRPSTVAFTGFTWFANAKETHDVYDARFYDPIWYIDNTNRREWWEDGYVRRCNPTLLPESDIELCKANDEVKSYADNGIYHYQRHYGENPYGRDNCVPIPSSGGEDCGPHTTIPPEGSGIEPVGPNWNYHNINYASNVLGLAVFDLATAPGSGASFGHDKVQTLRNLGHLFGYPGKGWYYHDIRSNSNFNRFNQLISGRADLNGATGEEILKGNGDDGFYVGYGVSTTVGFMRAGRILFRRLLEEPDVAHKKQFIIMITDGEENGFGFEEIEYNGEMVDNPHILRRFVETPFGEPPFGEPDEYSYNGEINGVSGKKVYGPFKGICDYIRKKISAQTVNIDGVQHNVEGKILVVGVGGSDGKSLYNRELFKTCVGDEALLFNEDNIDELIQVLKHGESGYISPIDS